MGFDTPHSAFHWRATLTEAQSERVYQRTYYQRRKAGEVMSNAKKLNDEKVREIRKLLSLGESQASVAARYGVCQSTIRDIKSGRYWGHVE